MNEFEQTIYFILFTVLAGFGGMVRYLKSKVQFGWGAFVLETSASALVGLLVSLVCVGMDLSPHFTGAIAGVAGFLGADTVKQIFVELFKSKTGIDIEKESDKKSDKKEPTE